MSHLLTGIVPWVPPLRRRHDQHPLPPGSADLSILLPGDAHNPAAVRGLPVIDQGRVYAIGAGGLLLSLDLRTGRRLWEREVGGTQTPWLAGDWLFVQTSDQALVAIRTSDGRLRWVTDLPRFENEAKKSDVIFWTGPVLVGNKLVLAGSNEQAVSVNPVTGKILGLENLRGAATVTPVAAGGTLLILTEDATLQAFR